ncbi:MAG: fimbrial assembly protein [Dictyoglomus sp. NZ13-RE01]|nr:MAG: fimbrial assembly protein [Dictyoglomus sp. NZ13-RE01]
MRINIWIILSAILLIVLIASYALLYRPLEAEKNTLLENIENNRQTLLRYQMSYKKLLEEWDKFKMDIQRYSEIREKLPSKEDLPSLLIFIEKTAKNSDLKINSFKPISSEKKVEGKTPPPYEEMSYSIDMEGSYGAFLLFLSRIKTAPRLILIKNLKIVPSEVKATTLKLSFILSTYIAY